MIRLLILCFAEIQPQNVGIVMEKGSSCIACFVNSFLRRIIGIRRRHEITPTSAIRSFLTRLVPTLPEDLGIVMGKESGCITRVMILLLSCIMEIHPRRKITPTS